MEKGINCTLGNGSIKGESEREKHVNVIQDLFRNWDQTESFAADSIILSETAEADVLYIILSGEIELSLKGEVLSRETAGGIIGESAILGYNQGSPTVRALTAVKLARLDREQFNRMIAGNPAFSQQVLVAMANRLRAVNAYVSDKLESGE